MGLFLFLINFLACIGLVWFGLFVALALLSYLSNKLLGDAPRPNQPAVPGEAVLFSALPITITARTWQYPYSISSTSTSTSTLGHSSPSSSRTEIGPQATPPSEFGPNPRPASYESLGDLDIIWRKSHSAPDNRFHRNNEVYWHRLPSQSDTRLFALPANNGYSVGANRGYGYTSYADSKRIFNNNYGVSNQDSYYQPSRQPVGIQSQPVVSREPVRNLKDEFQLSPSRFQNGTGDMKPHTTYGNQPSSSNNQWGLRQQSEPKASSYSSYQWPANASTFDKNWGLFDPPTSSQGTRPGLFGQATGSFDDNWGIFKSTGPSSSQGAGLFGQQTFDNRCKPWTSSSTIERPLQTRSFRSSMPTTVIKQRQGFQIEDSKPFSFGSVSPSTNTAFRRGTINFYGLE